MGGIRNPRPFASQAEAQAGTLNTVDMSPLRVAEAITALTPAQRAIASQAEAQAGTLNTVDMSPLRVAEAITALTPAQRAIASQAEAQAGTLNTVDMSPLRTAQAIAALASSGALVYLATVTAAGASAVTFNTQFVATYDNYVIEATNIYASGAGYLKAEAYIAGAWKATAYAGQCNTSAPGATVNIETNGTSELLLGRSNTLGTTLASAGAIKMEIMNVSGGSTGAASKRFVTTGNYPDGIIDASAWNTTAGAMTGLRFQTNSGANLTGKFILYGIKEA